MSASHPGLTPGEWVIEKTLDGCEVWAVERDGYTRRHVASHVGDEDAILIASAPQLLIQLKQLIGFCASHGLWDVIGEPHKTVTKAAGGAA
jgi:hypothetical protein